MTRRDGARAGLRDAPGNLGARLAPALGVVLLAPVTAEYLYGYDDSTGDVGELLGGLFLFAPLYGGAALLIREVARRAGRGWPTILLLGLAFGVLEAGLIDQSMFNPSYRDISYWHDMFGPTHMRGVGFNPNMALVFAAGHAIWSVAAPIALVETLVPARREAPWLRSFGLAVTAALFLLAAAAVLAWHLDTEAFRPSAGQAAGAALGTVALGLTAFAVGRRHPARPVAAVEGRGVAGGGGGDAGAGERLGVGRLGDGRAPAPWAVGATVLLALGLATLVELLHERAGLPLGWWPETTAGSWYTVGWDGFALNVAVLATLAALLVRWSARPGWTPSHRLAAVGGALLANVLTAFLTEPIGDVSDTAKYAHNTVALAFVSALLWLAWLTETCSIKRQVPVASPRWRRPPRPSRTWWPTPPSSRDRS